VGIFYCILLLYSGTITLWSFSTARGQVSCTDNKLLSVSIVLIVMLNCIDCNVELY